MKALDAIDLQMLEILQRDATTPMATIAEALNLSVTPCWRRLQRLKDKGYISKQVALVDPEKVNAGFTAFVFVSANHSNQAQADAFLAAVRAIPEVVGFYRMSGSVDYLLRVVVPDIAAYDRIYKRLIRSSPALRDVSSSFVMETVKFTTALPLTYAGGS